MAEIRDFHFESLRRKGELSGSKIILPQLNDDCTWEQIAEAYGRANAAIDEHIAGRQRGSIEAEGLEVQHSTGRDDTNDSVSDASEE